MLPDRERDAPHAPDCLNDPKNQGARTVNRKLQDRLPHGAKFTGEYNGETLCWSIKLTATMDGEERVFTRSGSAWDKLFHQIAGECRAWMASKGAIGEKAGALV